VSCNQARLRRLNDARIAIGGDYVLYWIQLPVFAVDSI
jgi:hypothetical protein